jgi:hypothetical protein
MGIGVAVRVGLGAGFGIAVKVGVGVGASERITSGRKMTVVGLMTAVCAAACENKPDARTITNATLKISSRLTGTNKRCMICLRAVAATPVSRN